MVSSMKTQLPSELQPFQAALIDYFAALDGVQLAVLYGSHARGQAGPLSDIDVALLLDRTFDPAHYFDLRLEVIGGLMHMLNTNEVDVVILNEVSLALRYRAVRDGVLLFYRDHSQLIEFVMRAVNEYIDFKPIVERHERAILARARRGELLNGYNPYRGALERYRQLRERLERTAKTDI